MDAFRVAVDRALAAASAGVADRTDGVWSQVDGSSAMDMDRRRRIEGTSAMASGVFGGGAAAAASASASAAARSRAAAAAFAAAAALAHASTSAVTFAARSRAARAGADARRRSRPPTASSRRPSAASLRAMAASPGRTRRAVFARNGLGGWLDAAVEAARRGGGA